MTETKSVDAGKRSAQPPCSVSAPTVRTDPVLEAIARKLFGIASVPRMEQYKMIKRAAKAGADALRKQNDPAQRTPGRTTKEDLP